MMSNISSLTQVAFDHLCADPELGSLVDTSLPIPAPFRRPGTVRLVILGQDPTVDNPASRKKIKTALNLDISGSLRTYLLKVCGLLGLDLDSEVYATNLLKNFFVKKPTTLQKQQPDFFQRCLPYWLPVLQAELEEFPGVPVITLGEPLLSTIVCAGASGKVHDYWGYMERWKQGSEKRLAFLSPQQTILERTVFPFPHQPSWQRFPFYSGRLQRYCAFVLDHSNLKTES
jgi:hypothetical protein